MLKMKDLLPKDWEEDIEDLVMLRVIMPIPNFTSNGELPPGVHEASLEDKPFPEFFQVNRPDASTV